MPRSTQQHPVVRPTVLVCGVRRRSYRRLLELQARRVGDVELRILEDRDPAQATQRPGAVALDAAGHLTHEPVAGMGSILRLVLEASSSRAADAGRIPRVV